MERQYIGARYVPIFADPIEWNDQRTYEPLTIVTYMGASYTSKKNVPAGIKPTDSAYWVLTGNYNAQVEAYRQEVVQTTSELRSDMNNLTDSLIKNVKQLEGKKVMIIGDSLSDPSTMAPNWVTLLKNMIAEYGVNATINSDFCVNGSSYSGIGQTNSLERFDNYTDEWDIIVIALGVNDYQGQWGIGYYNDTEVVTNKEGFNGYNFTAGMNNLLSKLRSKFPRAIQYGVVPHRTGRVIPNMKIPIAMYRYAIGSVLQLYGARIIDLSSMPMFAPSILGSTFGGYTTEIDVLHPSNVYAPILCNYMLQNINNGGANNWKNSGNAVSIPVLASAVGNEGQTMSVTYHSNGRIRVRCAISCNADVTGKPYVIFTDKVNYILADGFVLPKVCHINTGVLAECGVLSNQLYVRIPSGVTTLSAIYMDFMFDTKYPMNDWKYIID